MYKLKLPANTTVVIAHDSAIHSIATCASKYFETSVLDGKNYQVKRCLIDGTILIVCASGNTVQISLRVNDGEPIPWVKMSNDDGIKTAWRNPKFNTLILSPSVYHEIAIIMARMELT